MLEARASWLCLILLACGPGGRPDPAPGNTGCDAEGAHQCLGAIYQECVDGAWTDVSACASSCDDILGCVDCHPGLNQCSGNDVVSCNSDGTIGPVVSACGTDTCSDGECQTPCVIAAQQRSYIGCEYWPVDLDNGLDIVGSPSPTPDSCATYVNQNGSGPQLSHDVMTCDDGQSPFYQSTCDWNNTCPQGYTCQPHDVCANNGQFSPFAVVVSNPDPVVPTTVTLANHDGYSQSVVVAPQTVATLVPTELGFPDQSLDYSGIETKSYHLTSDRPIIAYQFNPLNNVGVYTNDGSLLIPSSAYDTSYYVLTHKSLARRPIKQDWNGYLTVVADDVATTVTVTPTAATRQGTQVPPLVAGQTMTFTLGAFQTLTLEAEALGDLTGTHVECTPACGVFAGHEATNLGPSPNAQLCCADHLEDMLFPASTWGTHYLVSRSAPRLTSTVDLVRVVAQKADTTLSLTPPQSGCGNVLQPGEFCEFYTSTDVEITATQPILVGHFLLSNGGLDADSGDPALSFSIPVEQYREDYTLLVPAQYDANFFAITVPAGGTAMLDGIDVTGQLTSAGTGAFRVGRVPVAAGQHQLACPDTCGVEAEGWSEAVSYLYAGGLNFEQIVLE